MGQKVSPIGLRLGINRKFDSTWYAKKKDDYIKYLHEDIKIRVFLEKKYRHADVSRIFIDRTSAEQINVIIHTYKVGLVVGRKGSEIDVIKTQLEKMSGRKVNLKVHELSQNDMDARVTALSIATAIEKRMPFKRAMNQAIMRAKKSGAVGIKIAVSGRLNGAEIARTESMLHGKVPLHSFRYEIDYASAQAYTISGVTGIKVWLSKGEVLG